MGKEGTGGGKANRGYVHFQGHSLGNGVSVPSGLEYLQKTGAGDQLLSPAG